MLFRPFQEPDADAVVALWQLCGLTRPWNDPFLASQRRPEMALAHRSSAQVRGDNTEALAFYEAIGYGVDDAVSMGKRLIAD